MAAGSYGNAKARDIIGRISGVLTSDDEVQLLNGLLALGYDPAQVQGLSDRDPSRRFLGDAVTRALDNGVSEADIKRAISFDQVARTEHDPVRRVQGLAQALGVDMGKVSAIANRNGGTPDAWINAVGEVGRGAQAAGISSVVGTDSALQTFNAYARSQQATFIGKGEARQAVPGPAGPTGPELTGPPASPHYLQQRGGEFADVAAARPGAPAPAAPAPSGPAPGGGGPPPAQISNQPPPPSTWNDDQIRDFIKSNFGSNAYFIDIPEVWEALRTVVKSGKGVNGLEPALEGTAFWKNNKAAARLWYVKERADPAQTAADIAQQVQAIQNSAQQAGITLDPDRARQMATSYLRYGWTQTDLQRAIGAEWHYDPSTKTQAAAVTKMKADARNWLVPLSDDALQTWGQGLISGTVTQEQWSQYLRDSAKSLMPQLSTLIDQHQGDPNFSVSTYADPYKQRAVSLLGIQADQVDLNDPSNKWRQALDTVDPKTGERRIMSLAEWDTKLKTDPTFGYDKTQNGIKDGLQLAGAIKTSFGF